MSEQPTYSRHSYVHSMIQRQHECCLNYLHLPAQQGEVEQISMMKPKALTPHETGLLEYLEDIIGTHNYVEHIEAGAKRSVRLA